MSKTGNYVTVNDRDGEHEEDIDVSDEARAEIWKAIGRFVDLSAASSFVAVIVAPPAPKVAADPPQSRKAKR